MRLVHLILTSVKSCCSVGLSDPFLLENRRWNGAATRRLQNIKRDFVPWKDVERIGSASGILLYPRGCSLGPKKETNGSGE